MGKIALSHVEKNFYLLNKKNAEKTVITFHIKATIINTALKNARQIQLRTHKIKYAR